MLLRVPTVMGAHHAALELAQATLSAGTAYHAGFGGRWEGGVASEGGVV